MGTRSKKDKRLTTMPNGNLVAYDHSEYRVGSIGTLLTAFYGGAILRKIERNSKDARR